MEKFTAITVGVFAILVCVCFIIGMIMIIQQHQAKMRRYWPDEETYRKLTGHIQYFREKINKIEAYQHGLKKDIIDLYDHFSSEILRLRDEIKTKS